MKGSSVQYAELTDAVLVVSVNQSFPGRSLYDAARFAWLVSPQRAAEVEYVVATKNRQIVGVFCPAGWQRATRQNFPEFDMHLPTRLAFTGSEAAPDVQRRYVGRYLPPDFKFSGTGMRYAGKLAVTG